MNRTNTAEIFNPVLTRVFDHLPYKPFCGYSKAATWVRPKTQAIEQYAYVQLNPPHQVAWLSFDLDHPNAWIWEEAGLPAPNLIVRSPDTGRAHVHYAIVPVCTSANARHKPINYMDAIRRAFALALKADDQYTGRITKNPLCNAWQITCLHDHEYDLGELAEYVTLTAKPFWEPANDEDVRGRNCSLFQQLRRWAYTQVLEFKKCSDYNTWFETVLSRALNLANVEVDFGFNEIRATAKSVAKWCWQHYTGASTQRGVMDLTDSGLSLKEKQSLAAMRTHQQRTQKTTHKLQAVVKRLKQAGESLTKVKVAALVGITRQHLTRHYGELFDALKNGTFATHQITAQERSVGRPGLLLIQNSKVIQERNGRLEKRKSCDNSESNTHSVVLQIVQNPSKKPPPD